MKSTHETNLEQMGGVEANITADQIFTVFREGAEHARQVGLHRNLYRITADSVEEQLPAHSSWDGERFSPEISDESVTLLALTSFRHRQEEQQHYNELLSMTSALTEALHGKRITVTDLAGDTGRAITPRILVRGESGYDYQNKEPLKRCTGDLYNIDLENGLMTLYPLKVSMATIDAGKYVVRMLDTDSTHPLVNITVDEQRRPGKRRIAAGFRGR